MNREDSENSQGYTERKGRFMYVDGQWYWVPNDFELVYKKITVNGKQVPFPFGFRRKTPEKCEIN